jgi:hypothetical protein
VDVERYPTRKKRGEKSISLDGRRKGLPGIMHHSAAQPKTSEGIRFSNAA